MSDTRRKASDKKIHRVTKGEHSQNKFDFNEYQNESYQSEMDEIERLQELEEEYEKTL